MRCFAAISADVNLSRLALSHLRSPIEPYKTGFLDVSGGHSLYWECSGNPVGRPAVFLHGGPGSGTGGKQRCFFDPSLYNIVLFDQRGAVRFSAPTPPAKQKSNQPP